LSNGHLIRGIKWLANCFPDERASTQAPGGAFAMVSRTSGATWLTAQDPHPLPGRRMAHSPRGEIDAQTLEIRPAKLTTSDVGDVEPVTATSFERTGEGCCPSFSTRSHAIRKSPASLPTAPSTPATCHDAMTPSPHARGRSHHPAAQERQTVEARHSGRGRAQRGLARIQTLRSDHPATMVRGQPAIGSKAAPNAGTAEAA